MYTKTFNQINAKNVNIAGGKGASLGEMTKAGVAVPSGFVILAGAFEEFLMQTKIPESKKQADLNVAIQAELDKVNYSDINSVERASEEIRDLIDKASIPDKMQQELLSEFKKLKSKYVAVRSSATAEDSSIASWAGELETYLDTTEKNLLENIKKCWSSLFTPRAIFYRHEKKLLKTKVSVAVVIQKMIESEISGITFTVHPVTKDKNQMIIEAGWGLGEAIVSGQITPDAYVVTKSKIKNKKLVLSSVEGSKAIDDYEIIDINVSEQEKMITRNIKGGIKHVAVAKSKKDKQKLNGKQIVQLAKICHNIEKHYKKPQDIEWAFAGGKFFITQSRPITTLN